MKKNRSTPREKKGGSLKRSAKKLEQKGKPYINQRRVGKGTLKKKEG